MQVLKGHIALGNARFPNGTNGIHFLNASLYLFQFKSDVFFSFQVLTHLFLTLIIHMCFFTGHALDILARVPLWKYGLDYRHGTGHGIGSYLNVHEGN